MKERLNFSGHQTFTLRYGWLPKAVAAISAGVDLSNPEEAMSELGVGKNMVASIVHWLFATGVGSRDNGRIVVTPLGQELLASGGFDQYLGDLGSLWLLHWNLASRKTPASTCFWLFNVYRANDFAEKAAVRVLEQWVNEHSKFPPNSGTLKRDLDCYLRAYVPPIRSDVEDWIDSPLGELGLLVGLDQFEGDRWFKFAVDAHRSLPDWVLRYAIDDFWFRERPLQDSISFDDLAFSKGSPGVVFKIPPDAMMGRLERLDGNDGLAITESNGVRNVIRSAVLSQPSLSTYLPLTV